MGAKSARMATVVAATVVERPPRDAAIAPRKQIEALEAEVERLQDALCSQEVFLADGYFVVTYPAEGGTYIAACPTLRASVQEQTRDSALVEVRNAMSAAKGALADWGAPLPPKDVTHRCLD